MIIMTHRGYEVSIKQKGSKFPLYVQSIRNGQVTYTTDYTHAKHYKTAKKAASVNQAIKDGLYK